MGMYDTVWVKCPSCGSRVPFQSKGGECLLEEIDLERADQSVVADILNDTGHCACGATIRVRMKSLVWAETL